MPSYPPEVLTISGPELPSVIRLSVASVVIALSIGKWAGEDIEEDEFEQFMSVQKVVSDGREYGVYRSPHEFLNFAPSGNLDRAARGIQALMIGSIEKGEVKPVSLRRALGGTIAAVETWLSTDSVGQWCDERDIPLHDLFYDYIDEEEKILGAGLTAHSNARFRAENKSDFHSVDVDSGSVDWQALYIDVVSKRMGMASGVSKSADRSTNRQDPRHLGTRERNVLLTIIAALCHEQKIDYTKPSKAAVLILDLAIRYGLKVSESAIEGHLKKIPDALETLAK
jgi:hypothetical protein